MLLINYPSSESSQTKWLFVCFRLNGVLLTLFHIWRRQTKWQSYMKNLQYDYSEEMCLFK